MLQRNITPILHIIAWHRVTIRLEKHKSIGFGEGRLVFPTKDNRDITARANNDV